MEYVSISSSSYLPAQQNFLNKVFQGSNILRLAYSRTKTQQRLVPCSQFPTLSVQISYS